MPLHFWSRIQSTTQELASRARTNGGSDLKRDDCQTLICTSKSRTATFVVTLPCTRYAVTYYKPAKSPQLLAKRFPGNDDPHARLTHAEFLARAWKLANNRRASWGGLSNNERPPQRTKMNAILTKALVALVPACMLLSGSAILFVKTKTVPLFSTAIRGGMPDHHRAHRMYARHLTSSLGCIGALPIALATISIS